MKVLLLGSTGLTGSACLEGLLAAPEATRVVAPVRRESAINHPKLDQPVVNFDRLESYGDLFAVDAIVCCLGTTISQAGSRERFRQVDYQYCLDAAALGKTRGARAFLLMSAVGAFARSPVFYNRVKGELEDSLQQLGFHRLSIYHPGLLLGQRKEHRSAEAFAGAVMPVLNHGLIGPLRKYRGIEANTVAAAMVNEIRSLASAMPTGREVLVREYPDIVALSKITLKER